MLWEECQHVWGGGGVGINMPWEGGINMSWGGGGGGGEGFNMPWKRGTCFGGDNMIKCLGGEGQHAFGGGLQGKGY